MTKWSSTFATCPKEIASYLAMTRGEKHGIEDFSSYLVRNDRGITGIIFSINFDQLFTSI
ncbi:hypothetical protein NPE20_25490 [Mucilaginibacter sp. JC4]|uniref:Uncharacterized protein n=1 Tax=Mucilaginibacter aquariorum TaxID=2967225 RepID=A0ABT1T9P3_9SPHI|nr:hypothetical protein [Mucilaginibacter aquariorum]